MVTWHLFFTHKWLQLKLMNDSCSLCQNKQMRSQSSGMFEPIFVFNSILISCIDGNSQKWKFLAEVFIMVYGVEPFQIFLNASWQQFKQQINFIRLWGNTVVLSFWNIPCAVREIQCLVRWPNFCVTDFLSPKKALRHWEGKCVKETSQTVQISWCLIKFV